MIMYLQNDIVNMYKVCAIQTGQKRNTKLLSIYDGKTEYKMHQLNKCSPSSLGYFVCKSKLDALRTAFPRSSKLLQSQRCLIRCRVNINDIIKRGHHENSTTFTATKLKPVECFDIDKVYPNKNGMPHSVAPRWEIVVWKPSGQFR